MQLTDDTLREILSQNIKSARLSSNLTQELLAENSDISLNFIKDIEGGRSGISLLTLVNLCKALNTTPNELLKDFFKNEYNTSETLVQQINLLNEYQKNAVYTLINYFKSNEM